MNEARKISRRVRREIDEPGLRASIAADLNVVVSGGGTSGSSAQRVRVRQGRSARAAAPSDHDEEKP